MSRPTLWLVCGVVAAAGGCIGSIGEEAAREGNDRPGPAGTRGQSDTAGVGAVATAGNAVTPMPVTAPTCTPGSPLAAVAPLRRLTRLQYDNTVADLLKDATKPAKNFGHDAHVGLFENNSDSPVTALSANQYGEAAEALARAAVKASPPTCAAAGGADVCAREFIRTFGKRAYRRPLADAEVTRLFGLYTLGKAEGGYADGVRLTMQAMLQSPNFFNHIERGVAGGGGEVHLTAHEIASRLSYFLRNTMPDATLFAAADAGTLSTPGEVGAQAMRMLSEGKANAGIYNFFQQWLELEKIDRLDRSPKMFPEWNPALRAAMHEENKGFIGEILWNGDAKLTTMLTATWSHANSALASLYGATPPAMGHGRVELDPSRRAGLLTQTALLTTTAHYDQTSPVHRGLLVRERFLCQSTPSPPPEVDVSLPKPDPTLTTRERFARHQAEPYCAGCHRLMDNIGLGFEGYDSIGRYRTTENRKAIDESGEIVASRDTDGKFSGPVELARRLAGSAEVRDCVASHWLAYATGTRTADLACAVGKLGAEFASTGTDVKKLVLAVVRSDAFRQRRAISKEVCR